MSVPAELLISEVYERLERMATAWLWRRRDACMLPGELATLTAERLEQLARKRYRDDTARLLRPAFQAGTLRRVYLEAKRKARRCGLYPAPEVLPDPSATEPGAPTHAEILEAMRARYPRLVASLRPPPPARALELFLMVSERVPWPEIVARFGVAQSTLESQLESLVRRLAKQWRLVVGRRIRSRGSPPSDTPS